MQYAYPTSDVDNSGAFTRLAGAAGALWDQLDEEPYSDEDGAQSPAGATSKAFTIALGTITDPGVHTGHVLRIRVRSSKVTTYGTFKYELLQTATVIHTTGTLSSTGSFVEYSFTLTDGEAANITDYAALRVRYTAIATDTAKYQAVAWIRLEIPDPIAAPESYISREVTNLYSGAYSLKMTVGADGAEVLVYQDNIALRPECKGRMRFRTKSTVASPGIVVYWRLSDTGGNVWLNSTTGAWGAEHDNEVADVTDDDWTAVLYSFTAHTTCSTYKFSIGRGTSDYGSEYSIYVDDASLIRLLEPTPYRAIIPQGGAPQITQSVGDFYVGDVALSAGELRYGNDGWWYSALEDYIWHLKEFWLKIGAVDSTYSELGTIFWGRTTNPRVTDEAVTFQVADARDGLFGSIPTALFDLTTYPHMDPNAVGHAIPILFGELDNLTPVYIDDTTVPYKYKIAGHALEDISAVYKDGVTLATPGDYSVNLALGEFTLVADPGDSVITCKAKGAKCKIEDGTYSAVGADILFHVLTVLNSPPLPKSQIDLVSFLDLQIRRTQALAAYLTEQTPVTDFIRKLQDSNVFHLIPLMNGTFGAFRYAPGTTGDETRIDQLDMASFELAYDAAPVRKTVVVKYGQDPTTKNWLAVSAADANIGYRYDQVETLEKESLLTDPDDAATLAEFYLNIIRSPEKRVSGNVPAMLLGHRPAEKIVISKTIRDGEGAIQTVLADEVYRALTLVKDAGSATVGLEAVNDIQSIGTTHNDIAHDDSHTDSHTDTPHTDSHGDGEHEDSYTDVDHEDDHTNVAYHDHAHQDSHADQHEDIWGSGDIHVDTHYDSHLNSHTDVPYTDVYYDEPHQNEHEDSAHSDGHGDIAHVDVAHGDSHEDVPHGDTEY